MYVSSTPVGPQSLCGTLIIPRPKIVAKVGRPRLSAASTPAPGEPEGSTTTLAEKYNYNDAPRPFKNPNFTSRLHLRTASSSTTGVKKNVKQILTLERERVSGGDGFLTAQQVGQKARGEPIEIGKKKKSAGAIGGKKGNIQNLLKGRIKGGYLAAGGSTASGISTPMETEGGSGTSTPAIEEDGSVDEEDGAGAVNGLPGANGAGDVVDIMPKKEVFTYHTPAAPPSLLPGKKYCDITGLHASYTDPRTKLRYKGLEVWHVVRNLGPGGDQAYLALRGAQTSLK